MSKTSANATTTLLRRMQSLADESRLRLLHLLSRHELGVSELADVLQMPQSTVSRHLKVLSDEGWTRSRRQGTNHLYRLLDSELDAPARKLWVLTRDQTAADTSIRQDDMRLARVLRDRESDSQSFFAGAAAEWDKLRSEMYGQSFSLSALLSLIPGRYVVADLGCGTGQISKQLAPHVQQIIAVDNSAAMLKAARKRFGETPNLDLRRGDLTAIPIDSGACDAALLILVLAYLEDPSAVLTELARILKPGGQASIVDLLPHNRSDFQRHMLHRHAGFVPDALRKMLADSGFVDQQTRIIPLIPDPGAKGPALFLATATRR